MEATFELNASSIRIERSFSTGVGASTLKDIWAPSVPPQPSAEKPSKRSTDSISIESADLDVSPWLGTALAKLARLRGLPKDWHSCNAAPPNGVSISEAAHVLRILAEKDLEPTSIGPSTDEGVCIAFECSANYADIECFNTGETLAAISDGAGKPVIWDVPRRSVSDTVAKIKRFMSG